MLTAKLRRSDLGLSIPALLILGGALSRYPLPWAAALVIGGFSSLLLLLHPIWGLVPLLLSVPLARLGGAAIAGMRISPAEVILAGVALAWLAQMAAHHYIHVSHPPLLLPFLLLLGAMLASLLAALSLRSALKELVKWGSMLVAYLFTVACVRRRHLGWMVGAILATGCGQALLGIHQFLTSRGPEWFLLFGRFMRAYGTFEQPNPYGGYLGLTTPLAVSLVWVLRDRTRRLAALAASLLMTAALVMSWSRGAWLGFAAAILSMGMLTGRRTALLNGAAIVTLALILSGSYLLPPILAERLGGLAGYLTMPDVTTTEITEANYALIERLAHWQTALRMWSDHPWLGVGIGNYAIVYPIYALPRWPDPLGHAHNYYLNMGAETGAIGLACYLIFLLSALWQAYRATQVTEGLPRAIALGTLGALVHLSVHSIFDNLFVHTMYLQLAVLLGLLAVIRQRHDEASGPYGEDMAIHG